MSSDLKESQMKWLRRTAVSGTTAALVMTAGFAGSATASSGPDVKSAAAVCGTGTLVEPGVCEWSSVGSKDTWTLPATARTLIVEASGGEGGDGGTRSAPPSGTGGPGASVRAVLSVTPGNELTIAVGAEGASNSNSVVAFGGFSGGKGGGTASTGMKGGGGGGATTLREDGRLLVVAGGGGGGGGVGYDPSSILKQCSVVVAGSLGGPGGEAGTKDGEGSAGQPGKPGATSPGGEPGTVAAGTGQNGGSPPNNGCSGGGGGGGGGYRGGAGGLSQTEHKIGGGGGGAGSSWIDADVANDASISGGNTGNGSLRISWNSLEILDESLPDGLVKDEYDFELDGRGGLDLEYDVIDGSLPRGITLSKDGNLTGTPTKRGAYEFVVGMSDSRGRATAKDLVLDVRPRGAEVADAPATKINARSAVGQATVQPEEGEPADLFCRIAKRAGAVNDGDKVVADPDRVAGAAGATDFTCKFDGLEPDTVYFYRAYAKDSAGVHGSGAAQTFQTTGTKTQSAKVAPPKKLKNKGKTVVLKRKTLTSAGQAVSVDIDRLGKTKKSAAKLIQQKSGRYLIKTNGKSAKVKVLWSAPGNSEYRPFKVAKTYKVNK